jgi:hypothetical protein
VVVQVDNDLINKMVVMVFVIEIVIVVVVMNLNQV